MPRSLAFRTTVLTSLLAGLAGTACGDPPPDKQLDTLRSWTATMRLAAADRTRGAVSGAYADDLHHKAAEALAGASIEKGEGAPAGSDRRQALAVADSLRGAIDALDQAGRR